MAVDNSNTVDLIGVDKNSGMVILTISDHLDWGDVRQHLQLIQDKVNCYLSFVESGQIYDSYPQAKEKKLAIELVEKYKHPPESEYFFNQMTPIIEELGIEFRISLLQGASDES